MDDGDAINSREAAAGLGLLGAALLGLVGTFVYRIVMENRTPRPEREGAAIVNVETPAGSPSAEASSADVRDSAAATAQAPDAPAEIPDGVSPGSNQTDESAASEAPPYQPEPMPRFVAPAGRADQ
jgi:hypothetical protein